MEELNERVKDFKDLMAEHKEFKQLHSDVFTKHRALIKSTSQAKKVVMQLMKEQNLTILDVDGLQIELKEKSCCKHDSALLQNLFEDDSKFEEYMTQVNTQTNSIVTRKKQKR